MELTIGELARRAGVRTSTIRYWERVGVLPDPPRVRGRRRYATDALEALQVVRLGKQAGFTLAELRALRQSTRGRRSGDWRPALHAKQADVRARLRRLLKSDELLETALGCGCVDFRACLAARLRAAGTR